jgi:hypothetical protein
MAVHGVGGVAAMSAVPEMGPASSASAEGFAMVCGPAAQPVRDADRRVVALAIDAVELLRPGSDLARLLDSFGRADVLLAAEDLPVAALDGPDDDPDDWTRDCEVVDEVRAGTAALRHPDLVVHRLALNAPLDAAVEDDLVAALSELIGFDPGSGVYCLAPATPPDGVLVQAARRIARVYGLPLLRYRCLELSLVETETAPVSSPSPRHVAPG